MSQKILIGAAVVAGGAYLYDQNVSPIFTREKVQAKYELQKLEHNSKDLGNKISETFKDTKQDLSRKTSELKKSVEKSDLYKSLQDKTSDFQNSAKQYKHDVQDAYRPQSEKPYLTQLVHKYIDKVNQLAGVPETRTPYSTTSRRTEVRQRSWWDSWFGEKEQEAKQWGREVKNDAESTKNSWLNWGSKKADEAERHLDSKTNNAKSEYYRTKGNAEGAYNDLKSSAEGALDKVADYGSKAWYEGKDTASKAYQSAKEEYDAITNSLNSADKQKNLEKAKNHFNATLKNLKAYGDDVVNDVNSRFK